MGFAASSDPIVRLAYWTGSAILMLVLIMVFYVLFLRYRLLWEERRTRSLQERWRPLLISSLERIPESFPPIRGRDLPVVFGLWSHFHETLKGDAKERLNQVARITGIQQMAQRLLARGRFRERQMAVVALGLLHDKSAWDEIRQMALEEHSVLSLAAMKALMRIDEEAAMHFFVPLISERNDWPEVRVASVLLEAGAQTVCVALLNALALAPERSVPRLVRYLGIVSCDGATAVLRQLMERYPSDAVISACLRAFKSPDAIDLVRQHLHHDTWHVRVQAVRTLGRMGLAQDKEQLIQMLNDNQWWVRYRAAQALASLPSVTLEELARIGQEHPDRYARDMIAQVAAERRMQ